jgi:four helix bundle protein
MKDNTIRDKSYSFAIKIVHLVHKLELDRNYVIAKQLLKSGTSISANVDESIGAESRFDFIHKFSIAYEESRETLFWLELLRDTKITEENETIKLINDNEEIIRIIVKIIKTNKEKLEKKKSK